jgi:HTH-like domain
LDSSQRVAELERKIGEQQLALDFFRAALRHVRERRRTRGAWREGIYVMIQASMSQQGNLGIERLCTMAGVSRAGYYRHWQANTPRQEETEVRDAIQGLPLANRRLGYRRITTLLRRDCLAVNHKRVERWSMRAVTTSPGRMRHTSSRV